LSFFNPEYTMSGHNRWSKIKGKKLASDARRSKGWDKQLKAVTLAASTGGPDPSLNASLRSLMEKAKSDGIPNDTIARAVKRGSGELGPVVLEELLYEAYGPGGAAVVVEVLTDNRNRAAAEIRSLLDHHKGKLAASGAVTYLFKRRGTVVFDAAAVDEEKLLEAALEAGADDVQSGDGSVTVLTEPASLIAVKEALEKQGFKASEAELARLPETMLRLEGKDAEGMVKLLNALDDNDDVQHVYANADIDDEVYERLSE
jgi:YebC/PmpR family DNA-binding regulatory protein